MYTYLNIIENFLSMLTVLRDMYFLGLKLNVTLQLFNVCNDIIGNDVNNSDKKKCCV